MFSIEVCYLFIYFVLLLGLLQLTSPSIFYLYSTSKELDLAYIMKNKFLALRLLGWKVKKLISNKNGILQFTADRNWVQLGVLS